MEESAGAGPATAYHLEAVLLASVTVTEQAKGIVMAKQRGSRQSPAQVAR